MIEPREDNDEPEKDQDGIEINEQGKAQARKPPRTLKQRSLVIEKLKMAAWKELAVRLVFYKSITLAIEVAVVWKDQTKKMGVWCTLCNKKFTAGIFGLNEYLTHT
ncbi:hypothetical protein OSB04_001367 [Centaurea solstitialis]|uniref:Uncharacterized protein n=1 Tax=Centaurea solstitialis TaxID=347529 RepID=A0AA38WUW9_9ASTR|nr:hypothetical protein OSB04_001367 [Centaurea solstitialis]